MWRGFVFGLAAVMTTTPAAAAFLAGNDLAEHCKRDAFATHRYIIGVHDAFFYKHPMKYCLPSGVTAGQMGQVACKYLQDNPEQLHVMAVQLVEQAFQKAWPCR